MTEEIIYTSAPQGLKPGSRGFCTVASTAGMASTLASLLESLSGYRHLAAPGDTSNPVVHSHLKARLAGKSVSILSRIADAGHDYSGRTNKLAHHVAFAAIKLNQAGPVATQQSPGFHETVWSGKSDGRLGGQKIPELTNTPAVCEYWKQITGDAGWGGTCAARILDKSIREVWIIYPQGVNVLRLLGESLALLPPADRWQTTYTTFYTKIAPGVECRIRCAVDGTPEANQIRKRYELNAIDLCRSLGEAPAGKWVEVARTGNVPAAKPTNTIKPESAVTPPVLETFASEGNEIEYELESLLPLNGSSPPPLPIGSLASKLPAEANSSNHNNPTSFQSVNKPIFAGVAVLFLILSVGAGLLYFDLLPSKKAIQTEPEIASKKETASDDQGPAQSVEDKKVKSDSPAEKKSNEKDLADTKTAPTSSDNLEKPNAEEAKSKTPSEVKTPAEEDTEKPAEVEKPNKAEENPFPKEEVLIKDFSGSIPLGKQLKLKDIQAVLLYPDAKKPAPGPIVAQVKSKKIVLNNVYHKGQVGEGKPHQPLLILTQNDLNLLVSKAATLGSNNEKFSHILQHSVLVLATKKNDDSGGEHECRITFMEPKKKSKPEFKLAEVVKNRGWNQSIELVEGEPEAPKRVRFFNGKKEEKIEPLDTTPIAFEIGRHYFAKERKHWKVFVVATPSIKEATTNERSSKFQVRLDIQVQVRGTNEGYKSEDKGSNIEFSEISKVINGNRRFLNLRKEHALSPKITWRQCREILSDYKKKNTKDERPKFAKKLGISNGKEIATLNEFKDGFWKIPGLKIYPDEDLDSEALEDLFKSLAFKCEISIPLTNYLEPILNPLPLSRRGRVRGRITEEIDPSLTPSSKGGGVLKPDLGKKENKSGEERKEQLVLATISLNMPSPNPQPIVKE